MPLEAAPQPRRADPVEPDREPAHRLVLAQRDPGVFHRVPLIQLPPRAGVHRGDQQAHHARQQRPDVALSWLVRAAAPCAGAPRAGSAGTSPGRAIASSETGGCPGRSAMTSPSRRTSMLRPGDGIVPPRLDDPEHAPGHLPAHRLGQRRQVQPRAPRPVVAERARVLRRARCPARTGSAASAPAPPPTGPQRPRIGTGRGPPPARPARPGRSRRSRARPGQRGVVRGRPPARR